jgi:hypothetical protein
MKKFSVLIATVISITLFLSFMPSQVFAWYTQCVNCACSSSNGGIEVQWACFKNKDIYKGVLTGVKGLPIGIEDFQRQEKTISQAMEKTSIIKKSTTQRVSTPAEVPAPAGTDTGKENVFSRKQSMSQSKTMGEGIRIDYTLAFVKWIGDHHPFIKDEIRNDPINVLKYLAACDLIMSAYRNGKIESFIEKFILSRNINDIQNVKLVDENKLKNLSDTEKSMILTKYISLLLPHIKENSYRINASLVHSAILEMNPEELDSMANLYIEHIKHIQKLKEPKSVLQLYNENDKEAAFAKWLAESKPNVLPHITDLNDRYIVFTSKAFYERIASEIPQLAQEFEKAIENKDESVAKVFHSRVKIVKEKIADVTENKKFFLVLLIVIPVIGIIVFIKIKKKHKNHQ